MLKRLVGDAAYDKALDLYFQRHDGQACTIEDWLAVFQDATGRDLHQFSLWYTQAGTPRVTVSEDYADGTYTLTLRQHTPATPGQSEKLPLVIPVAIGLLALDGTEAVPTQVLELTEAEQSWSFEGLAAKPVPSLLRGFSAPVILERETSAEERALLLAHDTDPFNKWEAGRALAKDVLVRMVTDNAQPGPAYLDALEQVARDETLEPAFRALALALPSQDDIAQTLHDSGVTPDPTMIWKARRALETHVARHLADVLPGLYTDMDQPGPYTPDAKAAGCRALRQTALGLMSLLDGGKAAQKQFDGADNMTEQLGALGTLIDIGQANDALAVFARQWGGDRLVMDKWFALQVSRAAPADAVEIARGLTTHPDFDWTNPNRFRSVIGGLAMNPAGFHDPSGAGYALVGHWLERMDSKNPQTAARMSTAFETWRRYDADRQALIQAELARLRALPNLSRDMSEMVGRMLG